MSSQVIERLKKLSLFKELQDNEPALNKVADVVTVRTFPAGAILIQEGSSGHEMYILNRGRVRIEKRTLEKESYTVTTLTDEMNVFFGELALMDDDLRSATVIAETECECLVVTKNDFERLGNQEPYIGLVVTRQIAKVLSSRLRRGNQDIITLFEALVGEIEK